MSSALSNQSDSVFRLEAFRIYWSTRVLSTMAFQLLGVAVGWQMYALTHSVLALGFIGLVQYLPMLLLTLLIGHVADRYDRRRIAAICQLIEGCAAGLLAAGSLGGWLDAPTIFAAVAVIGAGRAFEMPTMRALLPALVPAALFPRAAAYSASAIQTATIVGPALGGLIYVFGPEAPYACAAVLGLVSSYLSSRIGMERPPPRREPVSLVSLFSGFAFIRRQPIVLGSISLDLFAVLLGGATALLPVFARDVLHTGPWGLGLLRAAPAVGALGMSLWLTRYPLTRRVGHVMFYSVAGFGVATVAFGVSANFYLSLAALFVLGASDMMSVFIRSALIQFATPD